MNNILRCKACILSCDVGCLIMSSNVLKLWLLFLWMWRVHIPFLPDFVLLLCKYDAPCSKLKPYRSSHFHSKKLYNSNTFKFSGEFKVKQGTLTFHYFEHDICMGYGRYQLGSLTPRGSHYCVKKESQSNRYFVCRVQPLRKLQNT